MKIERTHSTGWNSTIGKGFVLYGNRPDNGKWFERWYPTIEKAIAFCQKRGWKFTNAT